MSSKRALLAYLSLGMKWKSDDSRFGWHQNYRQSCQIAQLLVDRGYQVDVVQYNDSRFIPSAPYDLIVAHPGDVSQRLQALPRTGMRLCLRTGRHAEFVNKVMTERFCRLSQRKGGSLIPPLLRETDAVYENYDAVVCFDGDGSTAETFRVTGLPVYSFRNYANPQLSPVRKNYAEARRGFIYMAGHLHVSKGLDWLIEAFAERPDLHLYICGKLSDELTALYKKELGCSNIHQMGFVQLHSEKFKKICRKAAWYISPSATDGCQGTALDAMASGLIPVLSDACGVNTYGSGLEMRPCSPETMRGALDGTLLISAEELEQQSRRSWATVETHYRPRHFLEDWNHILEQVGV